MRIHVKHVSIAARIVCLVLRVSISTAALVMDRLQRALRAIVVSEQVASSASTALARRVIRITFFTTGMVCVIPNVLLERTKVIPVSTSARIAVRHVPHVALRVRVARVVLIRHHILRRIPVCLLVPMGISWMALHAAHATEHVQLVMVVPRRAA